MDWVMSRGKFALVTELLSGFRVVGDAYGENVYGLVLLPTYRFSPHLEGVFRYQLSHGRDAVKMFARYVPVVTTYPKWVSTMNSFYFGLNYYVFPKDPNMLKFMVGGEYTATSGARGRQVLQRLDVVYCRPVPFLTMGKAAEMRSSCGTANQGRNGGRE